MLMSTLGHLCAVAVGLSLGLIGGGGSILAVPILLYVIGAEAKEAIAISLISIGVVSLIGAISHARLGQVSPKIALIFAPAAMIGAYLGAYITSFPIITETIQLSCFGITMVVAGVLMILKGKRQKQEFLSKASNVHKHWPTRQKSLINLLIISIEALGIGILTGFVGIGGGFAIVPTLVLLTKIPMKQAIGTSLLIISFKSVTGFVGYLNQTTISWQLVFSFTFAASLGTLLGSYLNRFFNADVLQTGFGYFIFLSAIIILALQFSYA